MTYEIDFKHGIQIFQRGEKQKIVYKICGPKTYKKFQYGLKMFKINTKIHKITTFFSSTNKGYRCTGYRQSITAGFLVHHRGYFFSAFYK